MPAPPFKMGQTTPVRVNSLGQPTPPQSSTKIPSVQEQMHQHLLRLEKGLSEAMNKLEEQARVHEKDKARADGMETEYEKMKRIVQEMELKRIAMKDIGVQTMAAPAPLLISVRRSIRPARNFVQAVGEVKTPDPPGISVVSEKENVSNTLDIVKHNPPPNMTKGALTSKTLNPPGATAHEVLGDLGAKDPALLKSVYMHFDKLDGGNLKALPRDSCLLMASLLLEERGIRHTSIPKVICSRMLKSVSQGTDGITLMRESACEFFQKVLEFIIDQER